MDKELILKEIYATRDTIKKLEEIDTNTQIGLEINRFVLRKFEDEYGEEIPEEKKKGRPIGMN